MEVIQIPNIRLFFNNFKQIEHYLWYCTLLSRYAKQPFLMFGAPAPLHIARKIATVQHSDFFGMTEMRPFLQLICTLAFFLTIQATPDTQFKDTKPPKDKAVFDEQTVTNISKQHRKLHKQLKQHRDLIKTIRMKHKNILSKRQGLEYRISKLRLASNNNDIDKDSSTKSRISFLKRTNLGTKEDLTDEINNLNKLTLKEQDLRQCLYQKVTAISNVLIAKLHDSLEKAYSGLIEASRCIRFPTGQQYIRDQMYEIHTNVAVDRLYGLCCSSYVTPNPKDLISDPYDKTLIPFATEIIPEYGKQGFTRQTNKRKQNTGRSILVDDVDVCDDNNVDCFFDKSGGVRTVVQKNLPVEALYGVIDSQPGQKVKVELSLLDGMIGFGWRKDKTLLSVKQWGFFILSSDI